MADHNDPNAVNSAFSDIDVSAADLYDLFGFPSNDTAGGEKARHRADFRLRSRYWRVSIATCCTAFRWWPSRASQARPRTDHSLETLLKYFNAVKDKYLGLFKPSEIRVTVDPGGQAQVAFLRFPGGDFSTSIATNKVETISTPDGHQIKAYIGGREEAFFNDLPGFFRSINYAPQFYHVPHSMTEARELPIPKTLLELEGNDLFNFDPANPQWGKTMKKDLPPGPWTWNGDKFKKDEDGNFRFVYDGDGRARGQKLQRALSSKFRWRLSRRIAGQNRIVNTLGRKLGAEGRAQGGDHSR